MPKAHLSGFLRCHKSLGLQAMQRKPNSLKLSCKVERNGDASWERFWDTQLVEVPVDTLVYGLIDC